MNNCPECGLNLKAYRGRQMGLTHKPHARFRLGAVARIKLAGNPSFQPTFNMLRIALLKRAA